MKKNYKSNPQTINKMAISAINNYFKCKWTKCSSQTTEWLVFVWTRFIAVIILKCTEIPNHYVVYQELT